MTVQLFRRDHDLSSWLKATAQDMVKRLENWDPDALLTAAEADVIEELIDKGSVQCPRLLREHAWMPPPSEAVQAFRNFGEEIEFRVPRLTLVVPFEGEKMVFTARPNQCSLNPPQVARLDDHELRIVLEQELTDGAQARALFDAQLDQIDKHLGWARTQVEQHNAEIRASAPELVACRRAKLLAARNLQAAIGYTIRSRPDAGTYSVPVRRRKLRPVRPQPTAAATRFEPEPILADSDYEAALAVLRNSRNALERSPSLAAGLGEEHIRDLLLISLNAQFEGDAAGEVFNGYGKTDILIRVEDRNIFIGECKIWSGPKTIDEALTQLFGYLVWRDTKAAVLLFIRNKNVTTAIDKAVEKIEGHPNFKRRGPTDNEARIDFIMHAVGDPAREIRLALLPFALRAR